MQYSELIESFNLKKIILFSSTFKVATDDSATQDSGVKISFKTVVGLERLELLRSECFGIDGSLIMAHDTWDCLGKVL